MMLLIVVVVGLAGSVDMASFCDNGWMTYDKSCYHFSTDLAQFQEAVVNCTYLGSSLIEPSSGQEENWVILQNIIRGIDTTIWIGLTDLLVENTYVYVSTGGVPSYINWAVGQPNTGDTEHCAALDITQKKWHDYTCAEKKPYICKKPAYQFA